VKLGLLGGTFDPVHYAHLFIAEAARVELHLDRVLFLPTRLAHHREGAQASAQERLAMLRGAIAPNAFFGVDETDLADDATGYTADLMPKLRAHFPGDHLTFIVGGDSLLDTPWQRFDEFLANLDAFVVAPRAEKRLDRLEGFLATLAPEARAKVTLLDLPTLTTSATLVRSQIARGGSIRYLVPDFVARYVAEKGLYGH
jgi:nicotinate-nucleotide adenylyltransferase